MVIMTTKEMLCLQLEYLPGWLFGITPSMAKQEIAPKLTRYREECFRVLLRAFQDELAQTKEVITTAPNPLIQVRDMALTMVELCKK